MPTEKVRFVHHDLDAPAFWNVRFRPRLYVDGGAKKGHRWLMQFALVPQNGPETLRSWEDDFRDILAYIESIPVPRWTRPVDAPLAERGASSSSARAPPATAPTGASPPIRA